MTERHCYLLPGSNGDDGTDVYGSFQAIATALAAETGNPERIEITFARDKKGTTATPPKKPKYHFYYDTHLIGSDGDGSEHDPWPDVASALRGLAELQNVGTLATTPGDSVVIERREVFTATSLEKKKRRAELIAKYLFMAMAIGLVLPVIAILGYLTYQAWPAFFPTTSLVRAADIDLDGLSVRKLIDLAGGSPEVIKGIAAVGVDDTSGIWEYSTDRGSNWTPFTKSGVATNGRNDRSAVLLSHTASVRFVPSERELFGHIEFRPWYKIDKSRNNGDTNVDVAPSWYDFILTNPKNRMTAGGIWAPFVGTFFLVLVSLLVSAPIGVLCGVYLNEYAPDNWFTRLINLAVVNLAGVPSIVHALFGVGAFVIAARFGESLLAASCTLAVMTLPVIITSTKEALAAVPTSFRMACWNMGATRWQTIRTIVLPNSISGILTGVILQVSRAAGETAPILFTGAAFYMPVADSGWEYWIPYELTEKIMALSMHLFTVMTQVNNAPQAIIYGTAVVLIGLVLAVNSASIILRMYLRSRKKW